MSAVIARRREVASKKNRVPYLSHSRVNRYLTCPEQYRLYYIEGLRPRYPPANLLFGQAVHQALAAFFQDGEDPVEAFRQEWAKVRKAKLSYGKRESWEGLLTTGGALVSLWVAEGLARISNYKASEKPFTLNVTSLPLPLVGVVDLVADLDGKRTVVDFKTSSSTYKDHEAPMSDQLTAYQMAEPEAEQVAFCVLVKTTKPRIEWHVAKRTGTQILEYLTKLQLVSQEITADRFYKRPGMWCSWCDFLPVCLGDDTRVRQTLIHVR